MKTIAAFCIFRDNEKELPKLFSQLEGLETYYSVSYFFYENDSSDNTVPMLEKWMKNRSGALKSEKLGAPKFGRTVDPARMSFLCRCRNKSKQLCPSPTEHDYIMVFDADISFSANNVQRQQKTLDDYKAVMVTANIRQNISNYTDGIGIDSYYDVYPFRDKYGNSGVYFSDCPSLQEDDRRNWRLQQPIRVNAAFGGLAIIRPSSFEKVKWSSDKNCDHVNFCYELGRYGDLFIDPSSKVYVEINLSQYNLEQFKQQGDKQREMINTLDKLRRNSII